MHHFPFDFSVRSSIVDVESGRGTAGSPRERVPAGLWVVEAALVLLHHKDTTMARTAKFSDLHYVLLATAANRASGSPLPPSSSVKSRACQHYPGDPLAAIARLRGRSRN